MKSKRVEMVIEDVTSDDLRAFVRDALADYVNGSSHDSATEIGRSKNTAKRFGFYQNLIGVRRSRRTQSIFILQ